MKSKYLLASLLLIAVISIPTATATYKGLWTYHSAGAGQYPLRQMAPSISLMYLNGTAVPNGEILSSTRVGSDKGVLYLPTVVGRTDVNEWVVGVRPDETMYNFPPPPGAEFLLKNTGPVNVTVHLTVTTITLPAGMQLVVAGPGGGSSGTTTYYRTGDIIQPGQIVHVYIDGCIVIDPKTNFTPGNTFNYKFSISFEARQQ